MEKIVLNCKDILSIEDMREALGIGRSMAYELVAKKEIRSIRIGNRIIIPKAFIEAYLNRDTEETE